MFSSTHPFTRLAALATAILGLVLVTAGQAAAMRPDPVPGDPGGAHQGSAAASVLRVTDSSITALQWGLFAAAVVGALVIGAALMRMAQHSHTQLAH